MIKEFVYTLKFNNSPFEEKLTSPTQRCVLQPGTYYMFLQILKDLWIGPSISTACLGINVGRFDYFILVFTLKRKYKNNTSQLNFDKLEKSTCHHIWPKQATYSHIHKILLSKTKILYFRKIIERQNNPLKMVVLHL